MFRVTSEKLDQWTGTTLVFLNAAVDPDPGLQDVMIQTLMSEKPANTAAALKNIEFDHKKWANYLNFELKCNRSCVNIRVTFVYNSLHHITTPKGWKLQNLIIRLLSRVDLLVCLLGSAKYSTGRVKLKTAERFFCMHYSLEPWYS